MKKSRLCLKIFLSLLLTGFASSAFAGSVFWSQQPNYPTGFDVPSVVSPSSAASPFAGRVVADDFQLLKPVTDIHWWGSYQGDGAFNSDGSPNPLNNGAALDFMVTFWDDIPQGSVGNNFSVPGNLVDTYVFKNVVGKVDNYQTMAKHWGYRYSVNVKDFAFSSSGNLSFFPSTPGVYWISIAAISYTGTDIANAWGWKSSKDQWNDLAVTGTFPTTTWTSWSNVTIPGVTGQLVRTDMAFELTTVPEPAGILLFGSGLMGLFLIKKRA